MNFTDELMEVWIEEKEKLGRINPETQKELYKVQSDRVTELEKRLTDFSKTELEVEEKAASRDMDDATKQQQMSEDRKTRRNQNIIEILKIGVPTTAAIVMGLISMKWEKTEVLTSTAGKSSFRDLLKFK